MNIILDTESTLTGTLDSHLNVLKLIFPELFTGSPFVPKTWFSVKDSWTSRPDTGCDIVLHLGLVYHRVSLTIPPAIHTGEFLSNFIELFGKDSMRCVFSISHLVVHPPDNHRCKFHVLFGNLMANNFLYIDLNCKFQRLGFLSRIPGPPGQILAT